LVESKVFLAGVVENHQKKCVVKSQDPGQDPCQDPGQEDQCPDQEDQCPDQEDQDQNHNLKNNECKYIKIKYEKII